MSRQRKIDKPFNFGYTIMDNEFPEDLHYNLNVPGIYVRKANKQVYFKDGRMGEMDASYIVNLDYKIIFEPMLVNGEHQSTPVGVNKIKRMGDYRIQQIHDENIHQFAFVASKIPKEKHKQ